MALSGLGCRGLLTAPTEFTIFVNSISAPDAIAPADTLVVRFQGYIGPDQCSRLDRVDRERSPGALDIAFRGERDDGGLCLQMPAPLDHVEKVLPPMQDPFTIRVRQPDGTHLVKTVRIEQAGAR